MKNKKRLLTSSLLAILTSLIISIAPASAASTLPCAEAINFTPYMIEHMRGSEQKSLKVPFTQTRGAQQDNCQMALTIFDPNGDPIAQSTTDKLITTTDSQLTINTQRLDQMLTEDGSYAIKFTDQNGALIEGILSFNVSAGAVLGTYTQRSETVDYTRLINGVFYAVLFAFAFFIYKAKKAAQLNH